MNVNTREGSVSYEIDGWNYGIAFMDSRLKCSYVCCESQH